MCCQIKKGEKINIGYRLLILFYLKYFLTDINSNNNIKQCLYIK